MKFLGGIWAILFLTVLGSISALNPGVFKAKTGDSRRQFLEKPATPVPQFFKKAELSAQPKISIYRENVQRTGVKVTKGLHPMIRPLWRLPDFNIQNHSASKSSPVSDGRALFLGSDRGFFAKVNEQGKVDWRIMTTSPQGIHGSAVIADGNVFWGDYNGILYSADKDSGSINWLLDLGDTIGSSPLFYDGSLFVSVETFYSANGFLARVNAETGQVQWLSDFFGGHPHSSPALSEDGQTIYVGANSNYLYSLKASTGQTNWRFQTGGAIKGTPAVWQNHIYFASWDGYFYKLDPQGSLVWKTDVEKSQSSATFSKKLDMAFISSSAGKTFGFELTGGKKVWEHKGVGPFMSSPVLVIDEKTGKELLYGNCHRFSVCQFDPKSGSIGREFRFDSRVSSVPLIENGQMYISTDGAGGFVKWY